MIRKNLSIILCLLAFSLQLSLPLFACVEHCLSRVRNCHLGKKQESSSRACPHSKASPRFTVEAKSGCDCAIQTHQSPAKEAAVTLDFSRPEISRLSLADFDFSSKTVSNLFEARLHSPPLFLWLTEQNTFLLNSNLRI